MTEVSPLAVISLKVSLGDTALIPPNVVNYLRLSLLSSLHKPCQFPGCWQNTWDSGKRQCTWSLRAQQAAWLSSASLALQLRWTHMWYHTDAEQGTCVLSEKPCAEETPASQGVSWETCPNSVPEEDIIFIIWLADKYVIALDRKPISIFQGYFLHKHLCNDSLEPNMCRNMTDPWRWSHDAVWGIVCLTEHQGCQINAEEELENSYWGSSWLLLCP